MALSRLFSKMLAHTVIEQEEVNPQDQWILPQLSQEQIYKHKSLFSLQASTLFIDKTGIVKFFDSNLDDHYIYLLDIVKAALTDKIKTKYKFLHFSTYSNLDYPALLQRISCVYFRRSS